MLGAIKFLLPVGIGVAGLVALAGKANAKPLPEGGRTSPGLPRKTSGKLTVSQVAQKMTAALGTGDPKVLEALAAELQAQGFSDQAKDLRGVAAQLAQIAAQAAGVKPPAIPSPSVATPPASMPQASPASPDIATVPPPSPPPTQVLPELVVTGTGPARPTPTQPVVNNGALDTVQRAVINLQSSKKGSENRDLVAKLQTQEKALGHYESFDPMKLGQAGTVDGLYGPGSAWAIAKFYAIVPPSPMYWPKNYAPALALYKKRLLELADADPARANEWRQAAQKAKV